MCSPLKSFLLYAEKSGRLFCFNTILNAFLLTAYGSFCMLLNKFSYRKIEFEISAILWKLMEKVLFTFPQSPILGYLNANSGSQVHLFLLFFLFPLGMLQIFTNWVVLLGCYYHCLLKIKHFKSYGMTYSLDPNHKNPQIQAEKRSTSLKEKLASVTPLVDDLRIKKEERMKQFSDIKAQIEKISGEISGYDHLNNSLINLSLEEEDLSVRRLTDYQTHLRTLQKEKVCISC